MDFSSRTDIEVFLRSNQFFHAQKNHYCLTVVYLGIRIQTIGYIEYFYSTEFFYSTELITPLGYNLRGDGNMNEGKIQHQNEEFEKITRQLQDMKQYLNELKLYHCFDALILSGLVAVVLQTFSYLFSGPISTDFEKTLFMFSLLVGPSAFLLLLLHLYELYGFVKKSQRSIPLTLDVTYFIYVAISFVTMIGLALYYQQHHISQGILTIGWTIGVILLCSYVLLALLSAKYLVKMFFYKRLPQFFEASHKEPRKRPQPVHPRMGTLIFKPKQIYYFRKKPDVSLWQNEEFFVRYK